LGVIKGGERKPTRQVLYKVLNEHGTFMKLDGIIKMLKRNTK